MKDLSLSVEQITKVLKHFVMATGLQVKFRLVPEPGRIPDLLVEFGGPEAHLLSSEDDKLLRALEELTAAIRSPECPELLACRIVSEVEMF